MSTASLLASSRHRQVRQIVLLVPKILVTAIFIVAVGDMIFGVFMRYVVTAITDWLDIDPFNFFFVEEVGEYSLAWMTMIGAAIGVAERTHFTLHLVTHRLPLSTQRVIHVGTYLLIAAFGGLAGWEGIRLAIVNSALTSPALELNLAWLYAAPAVGGGLIILYGLATAFEPPAQAESEDLDPAQIIAAGDD